MSERFTLAYEKGNWWAVRDGDITLWKEEVIATLNEFDEITIQQKKEIENLREALEFCHDLLDGTSKSKRMKELRKIIEEVVTDD